MRRRAFLVSALAVAVLPAVAAAQAQGRIFRVGWITARRAASLAENIAAFRKGLAELGYVEGSNLEIEFRFGDNVLDRVPYNWYAAAASPLTPSN